ncbi:N-acetylmuramoyl-L-alanine amidase [Mactra antiquata]
MNAPRSCSAVLYIYSNVIYISKQAASSQNNCLISWILFQQMNKMMLFVVLCLMVPFVEVSGWCSSINIISRAEWGARYPRRTSYMSLPVSKVFIHHTATSSCSTSRTCSARVRSIQNYHMNSRRWNDIGYNFLVGGDGNVYEGRGWSGVGAHTANHNSVSLGVAMIGNYMNDLPSSDAIRAAKELIECGVERSKISTFYDLFGHRDASQTTCPGDELYDEIQSWPGYSYGHP